MVTKLQAKTKEELVGELVETRRRLGELEEADSRNQQTAASLLESAKLFRTIADNAVDAIISGNKEGKITYWNKAAADIFGYSENEIIGQPVVRLVPEQYREAHRKGLRRVVETGETKIVGKTVELDGLRRDGTEFPLELSLSMAPTREGPVFTVVARDISMRKRVEKALKESEERYRNTLDNMMEGCQIIGFDWQYLYINDVAASHGHCTKEELLGHTMMEVYPGIENTDMFAALQHCMDERTPGYLENEFTYPDGATGWFELSIQPVPEGIFILSVDITVRKRIEVELRMQQERLAEAQRIAHLGYWDWDIISDRIYWSDEVYRIFGLSPDEFGASYEAFISTVHPDDVEYVNEAIRKALEEDVPYTIDHRIVLSDGSVHCVHAEGEVFFENEKPARMLGTVLDITELRRAQDELQQVSRQNERLLNSTGEGIYGVDVEGNATFVNPAALQMTGYGQEEVIGVNTHALWHHTRMDGSGYPEEECPIYATYTDGTPRSIDNEVFWRKDGSSFPVEYTVRAIFENDKQVGTVVSFQDITERRKAEKELRLNLERIKKITAGMTQALAMAAEIRDPYTAGHQQRVTDLAVAIAREMRLTNDQIDFIRTGGILHDVGKISVPAEILTNPRKLTTLELDMVKEHSQYSYEILKEAEFPWPVAELVAQHHERLDGSGYPKALKGDEIMLEAKILAVADVVEAMSSHRPYRPALGIEAAMEEISEKRGKLYEPKVVDACLRLLKEKKFSFKSIT